MFRFMKKHLKKIAITSGDKDGIGFEVVAKALAKVPASVKKNKAVFFVFRHKSQSELQPKLFKLLDKRWARKEFSSLDLAMGYLDAELYPDNILIDLVLTTSEALWVQQATLACKNKVLTSLVTGPLSKKLTRTLPSKPIGHTGIFRDVFPKKKMHMAFIGRDFNVLLATDHLPLSAVEAALVGGEFKSALAAGESLKALLKDKRRVAVLGLNPHAGEQGLLGNFEKKLFKKLPTSFAGPIVPDAAFLKKNWNNYSVFVCLYHDQGLIPFKMHHGQDSGVHVTVGLPFVRTSVDHGTAVDIFNKNIANPNSMLEAIELNLRLTGDLNV